MRKSMSLRQLIWMIILHWNADWSQEKRMPKKRFHLCEGCVCDWREWWNPTNRKRC
ncbi:hypothetical protein LCGC14_1534680 [marine sediment metagenome]|uniref:Uncharacterized protein n=1 Tax=marine sediment metagenome TaxID=412755 RepID=A0A0F9LVP4_9ZZZZ